MNANSGDADSVARLQAAVEAIESAATRSTESLPPLSEDGHAAVKAALRLLKSRLRSRHELASRLADKDFSADVIEEAMQRLDAWNLLDDAEFAQQWVHQRSRLKGTARSRLRHELVAKGIPEADVAAALAQVSNSDERDKAHELIAVRLRRHHHDDFCDRSVRDKITRRLVGFLQRRGYPLSMSLDVVNSEIERITEFR